MWPKQIHICHGQKEGWPLLAIQLLPKHTGKLHLIHPCWSHQWKPIVLGSYRMDARQTWSLQALWGLLCGLFFRFFSLTVLEHCAKLGRLLEEMCLECQESFLRQSPGSPDRNMGAQMQTPWHYPKLLVATLANWLSLPFINLPCCIESICKKIGCKNQPFASNLHIRSRLRWVHIPVQRFILVGDTPRTINTLSSSMAIILKGITAPHQRSSEYVILSGSLF